MNTTRLRLPLDVRVPTAWASRPTRWTASLTASAFLVVHLGRQEVRLGRTGPTHYPTQHGLDTLRQWARETLADDLAAWLSGDLPRPILWPRGMASLAEAGTNDPTHQGDPTP